jgi:hypothetical protein
MQPILIAATILAANTAPAQPPPSRPAAVIAPPKVFQQAGYAQPEIGPTACKTVNDSQIQCAVPAMTAGVYLVRAAGTSTAQAADAAQQLTVVAGDQSCTSTRSPDAKTPWAAGTKRTFVSGCVFTILTDAPLTLTVVYFDSKATRDPAGPQIAVTRAPWTGVINALPIQVKQP